MTCALRLIWLTALVAVIVGSVLPAQSVAMRLIDRAGISDKVEHFTAYAPPSPVWTASVAAAFAPPLHPYSCSAVSWNSLNSSVLAAPATGTTSSPTPAASSPV